jgi:hypothetical protein
VWCVRVGAASGIGISTVTLLEGGLCRPELS